MAILKHTYAEIRSNSFFMDYGFAVSEPKCNMLGWPLKGTGGKS